MDTERLTKLNRLIRDGKNPFSETAFEKTHYSTEIVENFTKLENMEVSVAGRVVALRKLGKLSFMSLQDDKGKIQIYSKVDTLNDFSYFFEENIVDMGDIIGVTGVVTKTQRGEISILAEEIKILSKSLLPLPEKFHGLKDTEVRYRQRYLDMIMNPDAKAVLVKRSLIISAVRDFLSAKGFVDVETPALQPVYGGAEAKPFTTYHNELKMNLFLRISPELYLKRLLIGGMEKVFEICKNFRNEGISTRHNPEFTMLEFYWAYRNLDHVMELVEEMISHVCKRVNGTTKVEYGEYEIDFTPPFAVMTMNEAILKYAKIDVNKMEAKELETFARNNKLELKPHMTRGELIALIFEGFAEKELIQPTFIRDYPIEISPLTKKKSGSNDTVDRFELFVCGKELGNAYTELNDPVDQRERFQEQEKKRSLGNEEANPTDEDFLTAVEYGMPPAGGFGMGLDRLSMFLSNAQSIRDVILFPTLKEIKEETTPQAPEEEKKDIKKAQKKK